MADLTLADAFSKKTRSRIMASVKGRDTTPERLVRSKLFDEGFRYRLHRKDLPGTPDIVLPRYRTIVFVNGCFWHSHDCPEGRRIPQTRTGYWKAKFDRNKARDLDNQISLESAGWKVFVIWTCQLEADLVRVLAYLKMKRSLSS